MVIKMKLACPQIFPKFQITKLTKLKLPKFQIASPNCKLRAFTRKPMKTNTHDWRGIKGPSAAWKKPGLQKTWFYCNIYYNQNGLTRSIQL